MGVGSSLERGGHGALENDSFPPGGLEVEVFGKGSRVMTKWLVSACTTGRLDPGETAPGNTR